MTDTFRLGMKGRLKHGDLLDALAKKGWTQSGAAKYLNVSPQAFGHWINLQEVPRHLTTDQVTKLMELTGKTPELLWPDYVRSKDFLDAPKTFEVVRDVDARKMLTALQRGRELLAAPPDALFEKRELRENLARVMSTLPPLIAHVLRERFFDGASPQEIADEMVPKITRDEVKRLEAKGLRMLRHPERTKNLRPFIFLPGLDH